MGLKYGAPEFPQFPVASGICTFLILLPISSHLKAGNVATLSMIFWLFVINLSRFVNTLVWANNVEERIPVWCDITTKMDVGVSIALPAAALCICRYLEAVASVRWARQTEQQKTNRKYFELFMCFGLPFIFMALHYISQGHRFDIIEHLGCTPSVVVTWVAFLTLYAPPMVLGLISFVYAGLAIRHFYRRRVDFRKHLSASNAGISSGRYLRLMMLALTEMILDTAVNSFIIWVNVKNAGVVPWTGWADVHSHFSRVQQIPFLFLTPFAWKAQQAVWWIIPVATIAFWSFFAFGQESMAEYRSWWMWFQRVVLRRDMSAYDSSKGSSTRVGRFGVGNKSNKNNSSTTNSDSLSGGSHSKTPRIHIPFPSNKKNGGAKKLEDDDSFVSGDDSFEKKHPISPISPTGIVSTPIVPNGPPRPGSMTYPELDTSIFDTISRNSLNEALESPSRHSLNLNDPYHPYHHGRQDNQSTTFGSTAVRAGSPEHHTNNVGIKTETQVSIDVV